MEIPMPNWKRNLFAFICLACFFAGCSPRASAPVSPALTPAAIRLTDGTGKEIVLSAPAERIVSLGPSNTEILFAIGARDRIAGCDQSSDYPEEAKPLATISAQYGTLDVEAVTALEPDLVLAAEIITPEQVQSMRAVGLTVFYLDNPKTLPEGLFENIRKVAALAGRSAQAETLIASLQMRVDAVKRKAAGAAAAPLVYFELDATDPLSPYTAGAGTFIDILIALAGGRNLAADLPSWPKISSEEILRRNPDIILLADAAFGVTVESVAQRPGWKNLTAVQNGAVYAVDGNLVMRPGPRLVDGLETIAPLIHPELFSAQ
jgi:iron complex transport system substrate-binding protein